MQQLAASAATSAAASNESRIVTTDASKSVAEAQMIRLIEQLMGLFKQAAQGHAAMTRAGLMQIAQMLGQQPQMHVQNIDARRVINNILSINDAQDPASVARAVEAIMVTLKLPITDVGAATAVRTLALGDANLPMAQSLQPAFGPPPEGTLATIPSPDAQWPPREGIKKTGTRFSRTLTTSCFHDFV